MLGDADSSRTHNLLERLHHLQATHGSISRDQLATAATEESLRPVDALGVASFYSMFDLNEAPARPDSRENVPVIHVCDGPSCRLQGSCQLNERLRDSSKAAAGTFVDHTQLDTPLDYDTGNTDVSLGSGAVNNDHGVGTKGQPNEFAALLERYAVPLPTTSDSVSDNRHAVDSDPNPFIRIDLNQCILCTRCARAMKSKADSSGASPNGVVTLELFVATILPCWKRVVSPAARVPRIAQPAHWKIACPSMPQHLIASCERRCEGFAELEKTVRNYTPDVVAELTGVNEKELRACAAILGQSKPAAVIWSMGITQHTTGVSNVLSLANLQMVLGNMGVAGGGVNPLRGQNNVQGACDLGALPNVYSGYQRVDADDARSRFENAWAVEQRSLEEPFTLDARPGLTVTEMIEQGGSGQVRALYILGEDPAMTEPNSNHARQCLAKTEFIVLQEIFDSETAAYADVLLPGCSFAEKHGTFTNTERRIQPIRAAIPPLHDSRPDWQITSELARRVLARRQLKTIGEWARWDYSSADDVLREINSLTPSYTGATPERIEKGEQLQWPIPSVDHPGTPILHVEKFARGLGRFHAVDFLPAAELPDQEYPYLLTTGRVLYHWHGGELTRRASALSAICPDPLVEISPDDGDRLDIVNGTRVIVSSRRGELHALARVTTRVSAGVLFANFHFPGTGNANNLTVNHVDPIAKIPEYKVCAVRLQKVE